MAKSAVTQHQRGRITLPAQRKVIERAKGVLMQRLGMNEEEAFRTLRKTSMDQNRRLLDVAEATLSLPDLAFAQSPNAGKKNGH